MIAASVELVTASKIVGHASIQMTMRYAHPTPENMQRAVDKLGEILESSIQGNINKLTKIESSEAISFFYH